MPTPRPGSASSRRGGPVPAAPQPVVGARVKEGDENGGVTWVGDCCGCGTVQQRPGAAAARCSAGCTLHPLAVQSSNPDAAGGFHLSLELLQAAQAPNPGLFGAHRAALHALLSQHEAPPAKIDKY